MKRLLILVGDAGVGKTTIRGPLAERLRARALGPDDHPYRWDWAIRQLQTARGRTILECCQIPRQVRAMMTPDTIIVELTASEEARRRNLKEQGHSAGEVAIRMLSIAGIGWGEDVRPDLSIDVSDADPDAVADEIAAAVDGLWGNEKTRQDRSQRASRAV